MFPWCTLIESLNNFIRATVFKPILPIRVRRFMFSLSGPRLREARWHILQTPNTNQDCAKWYYALRECADRENPDKYDLPELTVNMYIFYHILYVIRLQVLGTTHPVRMTISPVKPCTSCMRPASVHWSWGLGNMPHWSSGWTTNWWKSRQMAV